MYRILKHIRIPLFFVALYSSNAYSQLGGSSSFTFLNLIPSSRLVALGGSNVSLFDKDVNTMLSNPAFLDSTMSKDISINYQNYLSDITYGYSSYTHHFSKIGTFSGSLLYANYGKFIRADEIGNQLGKIPANDLAVIISYGKQLDSLFQIGTNLKLFTSSYDVYTASGVALDVTGAYFNKSKGFSVGAAITNVGFKFDDYTESTSSKFPTQVKLGVTKKLKHAPLRLSLTLDNLQKWDLTYEDPNAEKQFDPTTFEELPPKEPSFFDKGLRHVVLGTEILFSKNFHLQFGFDYRRRRELSFSVKPGLVGFSAGIGIRVKTFNLNYGIARYHLASASHNLSISTNLNNFRSK